MKTRLKKNMFGLLLAGLLLVTPVMALASTINFSGIDDNHSAQFNAEVTIDGSTVTGASFTINGGTAIVLTNLTLAFYNPGVSLTIGGNDGGDPAKTFSLDYYCTTLDKPYNSMIAVVDSETTYFVSSANLAASGAACVPLPGALVLLGSGLVGLLGLRRNS